MVTVLQKKKNEQKNEQKKNNKRFDGTSYYYPTYRKYRASKTGNE